MKKIRNIIPRLRNAATVSLAAVLTGCYSVDEGELVVRTSWGKTHEDIDRAVKESGLHGTWVIGQRSHPINVRTQKFVHTTETYTNDVQQAEMIVTVNFYHKKEKIEALNTYKKYGTKWADVILPQHLTQILKDEIGHWEAAELVSNRDKASSNIEKQLKRFFQEGNYPIVIETFTIDDISYKPDFEKAVEEKVIARQNFLKEQNNTARIEELNKQTISRARAEAEAMDVLGAALRRNPATLQLKALEKWNGVVSQVNGNIPFVIQQPQK